MKELRGLGGERLLLDLQHHSQPSPGLVPQADGPGSRGVEHARLDVEEEHGGGLETARQRAGHGRLAARPVGLRQEPELLRRVEQRSGALEHRALGPPRQRLVGDHGPGLEVDDGLEA